MCLAYGIALGMVTFLATPTAATASFGSFTCLLAVAETFKTPSMS